MPRGVDNRSRVLPSVRYKKNNGEMRKPDGEVSKNLS